MQETQHTQQTTTRTALKPRLRNSMGVDRSKNTEDSQIHETNICKGKNWSTTLERSATNAT